MHIHILGICGTFMAGIAVLAKQAGHTVTGSDQAVYPPMSHQLEAQGIQLRAGYDPAHIDRSVDCVIVGNVIRRGNPAMEFVMENNISYTSGPAWLAENILRSRWVLAVSGTHGKTTTTSMLAWILEYLNYHPGFLIGGVPENFGISARVGESPYFVIEADEYDSAFFDKRSKFIHYHPRTLILNNLEFDHADIFPDLDAIKQQFHFLVRTVPSNGKMIRNATDPHLKEVLDKGCWTPVTTFGGADSEWQARLLQEDGSHFVVIHQNKEKGEVKWELLGKHNVNNALAAIAAVHHTGVLPQDAVKALSSFKNVKRRLEMKACVKGITIYDDFAHHPTAIATTLEGLKAKIGNQRLIVVLEFGSYTMRSGVHREHMMNALKTADIVLCKEPQSDKWRLADTIQTFLQPTFLYENVDKIVENLAKQAKSGDHIVIMSNSGFDGIHQLLLNQLA